MFGFCTKLTFNPETTVSPFDKQDLNHAIDVDTQALMDGAGRFYNTGILCSVCFADSAAALP